MLERNDEIPERYFIRAWLTRIYLEATALAIRRQSEPNRGVVSIGGLWAAIGRNPQVITEDRYLIICNTDDGILRERAKKGFERWSNDGSQIDSDLIALRLEQHAEVSAGVKAFADTRVAHSEIGNLDPVTFGELNKAIDILGLHLQELHLLLTCGTVAQVEPIIQPPWTNAFMVPWQPPQQVDAWNEAMRVLTEDD